MDAGGGDGPLGSSGEDGLDGGDDRGWGRRRAEVCGHFVFSAVESGGGASRLALQAHGQGASVASGVRSTGATPAGPRDWGSECGTCMDPNPLLAWLYHRLRGELDIQVWKCLKGWGRLILSCRDCKLQWGQRACSMGPDLCRRTSQDKRIAGGMKSVLPGGCNRRTAV